MIYSEQNMLESVVKETQNNGSFSFLDRRKKQEEDDHLVSREPAIGRPPDLRASFTLLQVIEPLGLREPWFFTMVELLLE